MRYIVFVVVVLMLCNSCKQDKQIPKLSYNNPIISGFYPDPSICRVGDDYYLVNSSFSFFPGLPIFHSKDLVNWNQIGNVIDRPEQISYDSLDISEGLYAPTIRYHNGLYYVVCTRVANIENFVLGQTGNFVVTATNPAGPWSNPVYLPHIGGIDPDLFFDDDGKAYVTSCADPDSLIYGGHRTIRMHKFNLETLETTKESISLVDGGTDISKQPIWVEGPHLYKTNDFYYLMCAQGGTDLQHSEVIFRAKQVEGPYESYAKNPILTQKHLPSDRTNPVTNVGHADLVQTQNGDWWTVFLACRPYDEQNFFNTGRETFLLPVTWENNWPIVLKGDEKVPYEHMVPDLPKNKQEHPLSGNFEFTDEFNYTELPYRWLHIRAPKQKFYHLDGETLEMDLITEQLNEVGAPAFIGHRQQHTNFTATVELNFNAQNMGEEAGMALFQNERFFYYVCQSIENNQPVVRLYQSENGEKKRLAQHALAIADEMPLNLKIESNNKHYMFSYSTNNTDYIPVGDPQDVKYLSTNAAGGFVGTIIGMHTVSVQITNNTAIYKWFTYVGNDSIY